MVKAFYEEFGISQRSKVYFLKKKIIIMNVIWESLEAAALFKSRAMFRSMPNRFFQKMLKKPNIDEIHPEWGQEVQLPKEEIDIHSCTNYLKAPKTGKNLKNKTSWSCSQTGSILPTVDQISKSRFDYFNKQDHLRWRLAPMAYIARSRTFDEKQFGLWLIRFNFKCKV